MVLFFHPVFQRYNRLAREWTQKYAMWEPTEHISRTTKKGSKQRNTEKYICFNILTQGVGSRQGDKKYKRHTLLKWQNKGEEINVKAPEVDWVTPVRTGCSGPFSGRTPGPVSQPGAEPAEPSLVRNTGHHRKPRKKKTKNKTTTTLDFYY